MPPSFFLVMALFVGLVIGYFVSCLMHAAAIPDPLDVDSRMPPPAAAATDPWELQAMLMTASDQYMPDHPALTKGTVLYGALIMEEVGETLDGLQKLLHTVVGAGPALPGLEDELAALVAIRDRFFLMGDNLKMNAKTIRGLLETVESLYMPLAAEEAREVFDGTTDIAVVNCGLALSTGLPGAEGYREVVTSNLSKRNPDTGKIDKTPDGKWIKGRDYKEPNLDDVLVSATLARAWARAAIDHHPV